MVQNLEGGIVEKLLVKEGDVVKKGQILLKIDNGKSKSDYKATNLKSLELTARIVRLEAEVNNKEFNAEEFSSNAISQYIVNEKKLYIINMLPIGLPELLFLEYPD